MKIVFVVFLCISPVLAQCPPRPPDPPPPHPFIVAVQSALQLLDNHLVMDAVSGGVVLYRGIGKFLFELGCASFGAYYAAISNIAYAIQSYADQAVPQELRYGGRS